MKRFCILMVSLLMLLLLCGCSKAPSEPSMYVTPAQLTEEEQAICALLDIGGDSLIFDFQVDDTVKVMDIRAYELVDGTWDPFIGGRGGGVSHTDATGRFSLDFEKIPEGLRMGIQSQNRSGSNAITRPPIAELSGMGYATSLLSEKTQVIYEQEIPLAIQVFTTKDEIRSFDISCFFQPEVYEEYDYEHVYAITVFFSQQPLS